MLLAGAAMLLGGAILARTQRLLRWWHLPTALFSAWIALVYWALARPPTYLWLQLPPDPVLRHAVLLIPAVAVIVVACAANAALAAGPGLRLAGVALLPLVVLSLGALSAISHNTVIGSHVDPAAVEQQRIQLENELRVAERRREILIGAAESAVADVAAPPPVEAAIRASAARTAAPADAATSPDDAWHPGQALRAGMLLVALAILVSLLFRIDPEDWIPRPDRS